MIEEHSGWEELQGLSKLTVLHLLCCELTNICIWVVISTETVSKLEDALGDAD